MALQTELLERSLSPKALEDQFQDLEHRYFELRQERLNVQKKTFTKWANVYLQRAGIKIDDLFVDICDGKKLMKLIEIITGEKLGKPALGHGRINRIENISRCLAFLHSKKMRLENISSEDIVDGNSNLILGLLWTLILRCELIDLHPQDASAGSFQSPPRSEPTEQKIAKDSLLLWCQTKTDGYPGVRVRDFHRSWRDGLAFNALIHSHLPNLVDFGALDRQNHIKNLNNAFEIAETHIGVPKLLDPEDVDTSNPDDKSIMIYVASYCKALGKIKEEMTGGKRITNILGQMMEADKLKKNYETSVLNLLQWIDSVINELSSVDFPNSLEDIQKEVAKFKEYRTVEKPQKYDERNETEALLFSVQMKLKALGQAPFVPPEGMLVQDIEKAWSELEKAEHEYELLIRDKMKSQELLENLAYKFESKCLVRDGYLKEMVKVLSDPKYGVNLGQIDATVKKHESISAGILTREDMLEDLFRIADVLTQADYWNKQRIGARKQEVLQRWNYILDLLQKYDTTFSNLKIIMNLLQEIDTVLEEVGQMQEKLSTDDLGNHLIDVENLLQEHKLTEVQIKSWGETIQRLNVKAQNFVNDNHKEAPVLEKQLVKLNDGYKSLVQVAATRRTNLEESQQYYQFIQDFEEENSWILEKQILCKAALTCKDLLGALALQQKHKALELEVQAQIAPIQNIEQEGLHLNTINHPKYDYISERVDDLKSNWEVLKELQIKRTKQLEALIEAYQYHTDANEVELWIAEKKQLMSTNDCGKDELTSQALLKRHVHLETEILRYSLDVNQLHNEADRISHSEMFTSDCLKLAVFENDDDDEWIEEMEMVVEEEWVEEIFEKEVMDQVIEERKIPQVEARYHFKGQGVEVEKGEILILLKKTNDDWWNVRKSKGKDGFVPASYVREIEPLVIKKQNLKPVKSPEKRKVKKTVMREKPVKKRKAKPQSTGASVLAEDQNFNCEHIQKRQQNIEQLYAELKDLTKVRHQCLEDAIHLFRFHKEYDELETWIANKENSLTSDDINGNIEEMEKKFENFVCDLISNSLRIEELNNMVKEFEMKHHSQLEVVKSKSKHINDRWNHLKQLKEERERSLEGANSLDLFYRTCDEASVWMNEKLKKFEIKELGHDIKTVQMLQKRHQNLERELNPIQEKINRVNLLGESVRSLYPKAAKNINARIQKLEELWILLQEKATERRAILDDSVGFQILKNSAKALISWAEEVIRVLSLRETVKDVSIAESFLKDHQDIGDDIIAHDDEFLDTHELGIKLLKKNQESGYVIQLLQQLEEERQSVHDLWQEKGDWLRQCLDLQIFNREADQIDSITSSHEALLEFEDLGTTLDDVGTLLKRHENFINTLKAQDERQIIFNEMADKLMAAQHYESSYIDSRRQQVLERRIAVKEKAQKRKSLLLSSYDFQLFRADASEMSSWINEKIRVVSDESYKALINLHQKLKRHESFEAELHSNEKRLDAIYSNGQSLILESHYAEDKISEILTELNNLWEDLCFKIKDLGNNLRQAIALLSYNKTLEITNQKLDEFERILSSDDFGSDLRSTKNLIKKQELLENEVENFKMKLYEVIKIGDKMAEEGHFDSQNILKSSESVTQRIDAIKKPASMRYNKLLESLKYHQFKFQVSTEILWIREHIPSASSAAVGRSLFVAQNLSKKHENLELEIQGHQPMIDKTLETGKVLIDEKCNVEAVKASCEELDNEWRKLKELSDERKGKLNVSLKAQMFFSEVTEIESWINEKLDVLCNTDYGKDEDAVIKLLTKHKALELEIDTYSGLVNELSSQAQIMIESNHRDSKVISNRMQVISQEMKNIQKLSSVRRQKLLESKNQHEFFKETEELKDWISEKMLTASSEDYGEDYEHLLELHSKFEFFTLKIKQYEDFAINQYEEFAKKMISSECSFTKDVKKNLDYLSQQWALLLEYTEARTFKLKAAGEIHRYNRDVSDILLRIQEKYCSISDDVGRNLASVQDLLKKHENLVNDLLAIEAQVHLLMNDSETLQETYPGGNAEHIQQQLSLVIEHWNSLEQKVTWRKNNLIASLCFQEFLTPVRDIENWVKDMCNSLGAEEKAKSYESAKKMKSEHEQIKAEIEARNTTFDAINKRGEELIESDFYKKDEVEEKLKHLLKIKEDLHKTWEKRNAFIDQLCEFQSFLRDFEQLDALYNEQEVHLCSSEIGSTVEDIDNILKKHVAFEKMMIVQNEKLTNLETLGEKLIQQEHFEIDIVKSKLEEATSRHNRIKELSVEKNKKLADALLYAKFKRNVAEAESWIEEKKKFLEALYNKTETFNLEDKLKSLQKHQSFQAEIFVHESNIVNIKEKGEILLSKNHEASSEILKNLEELLQNWNELLESSAHIGKELDEAQDILAFNDQIKKAEAWIREKELMVLADDTGEDYEHCLSLQRKVDDFDSDMRMDESRIKSINNLAEKLIYDGQLYTDAIKQRQETVNEKWQALKIALDLYQDKLSKAAEVHAFIRDIYDTNERINEKNLILTAKDEAKDLESIKALKRKQEVLERDISTIQAKLNEHETEVQDLIRKHPDAAQELEKKISETKENWMILTDNLEARKQYLSTSYTLLKFISEVNEVEMWVTDIVIRMEHGELASNSTDAEQMLEMHRERKAEIEGRQSNFNALKDFGTHLLKEYASSAEIIESYLELLEELNVKLTNAWEERRQLLSQCCELQAFKEQAKQVDNWLCTKEAFLKNEDIGESVSSVEALIRKHDNFEKTMIAQKEKIDNLKKFADELIAHKHYDSSVIQSICLDIGQRQERLIENALLKRRMLEDAKLLHLFLLTIYEVSGWINQKMQLASDESYRDPTNLLSKIQKHAAFEAEIFANEGRVTSVTEEGIKLLYADHFESEKIRNEVDTLGQLWNQLLEKASFRKERLQDSYQALQFNHMLDEMELWMEEVENQLSSEDYGHDLSSVNILLKKHQQLETDVNEHAEKLKLIKDLGESFQKNSHFLKDEIEKRISSIINRFQAFHEPLQIRHENLEDTLLLEKFYRDTEDELVWIREKNALASSQDLGDDIMSVQSLQKKHQALETEISTHESLLTTVINKGRQLIRAGHFAMNDVENRIVNVQTELQELKDLCSIRRLRLVDALESQTYYFEAAQAEIWMKEKQPILASSDCGKDVESAEVLIKKMEGIQTEINNFKQSRINVELEEFGQNLTKRGHFDSENIIKRQEELESNCEQLQRQVEEKITQLQENKKYFSFVQDADDLSMQLKHMMIVTSSEDCGRDVEHVEILIQKFDDFLAKIYSYEDKITLLMHTAKSMIDGKHLESEKIQEKIEDVKEQWEELKESAHSRSEALGGAKLVHTFDKSADETISWIHEKDIALSTEDYGHDLESIKRLVRDHESFERDLKAVNEQVTALEGEADRLASQFPDAKEHINAKHEAVMEAWNSCLEKSAQRKDRLHQAEQLQAYFDDYREILAWLNEMMAIITSDELPQDVISAETLLNKHKEHKSEIDTQIESCIKFQERGENIIESGHFMSEEIKDRINRIKASIEILLQTWEKRQILYEQNLDLQQFKRDAELLEAWLQSREAILKETQYGESIEAVDDLIRKHEDFQKTIESYEDKFLALNRTTKLEEAFLKQKGEEDVNRKKEKERLEEERIAALKLKEQQRLLEERQKEEQKGRAPETDAKEPNNESVDYEEGEGFIPLPEEAVFKRIGSTRSMPVEPAKSNPKVELKQKSRHIPSFKITRKESHQSKWQPKVPPPTAVEGFLERKQEFQSGGKRSTTRHWKTYYTVLCGQLLCFFKDKAAFNCQNAAKPPLSIRNALCSEAKDYRKRKHVFRLQVDDKSEFLFMAPDRKKEQEWINKIKFSASLLPRMQLLNHDTTQLSTDTRRSTELTGEETYTRMSAVDVDYDNVSSSVTLSRKVLPQSDISKKNYPTPTQSHSDCEEQDLPLDANAEQNKHLDILHSPPQSEQHGHYDDKLQEQQEDEYADIEPEQNENLYANIHIHSKQHDYNDDKVHEETETKNANHENDEIYANYDYPQRALDAQIKYEEDQLKNISSEILQHATTATKEQLQISSSETKNNVQPQEEYDHSYAHSTASRTYSEPVMNKETESSERKRSSTSPSLSDEKSPSLSTSPSLSDENDIELSSQTFPSFSELNLPELPETPSSSTCSSYFTAGSSSSGSTIQMQEESDEDWYSMYGDHDQQSIPSRPVSFSNDRPDMPQFRQHQPVSRTQSHHLSLQRNVTLPPENDGLKPRGSKKDKKWKSMFGLGKKNRH